MRTLEREKSGRRRTSGPMPSPATTTTLASRDDENERAANWQARRAIGQLDYFFIWLVP
jgi:hypothetical protein